MSCKIIGGQLYSVSLSIVFPFRVAINYLKYTCSVVYTTISHRKHTLVQVHVRIYDAETKLVFLAWHRLITQSGTFLQAIIDRPKCGGAFNLGFSVFACAKHDTRNWLSLDVFGLDLCRQALVVVVC